MLIIFALFWRHCLLLKDNQQLFELAVPMSLFLEMMSY
jgi:hypothetical protein